MDEHDPVGDDEFVFRRIHRTLFDPTLPIPVQFPAFRPSPNDTKGISLFRECFGSPEDTLAQIAPAKINDYFVVRLSVRELRVLGLSVVADPVHGAPLGHAVIPDLNWVAYQAKKQFWKPILVELAKLASADIVHRPT